MRVCMLSEVRRQTTVDGGQGAARRQCVAPPKSSPQRDELSAALAACRGAFFGIGLFSGVINVLMLTGSFYMLEVYDRVLPSRSLPTLAGLTILAGGLPVGDRAFVFIIEAASNEELDQLLRSIPAWGVLKWKVTPLQSFSGRAAQEREVVKQLK